MSDEPVATRGVCRPDGIAAITLFSEDLQASRNFYDQLLDLPIVFEDADSFVLKVGSTLVNVLAVSAATELVEPAPIGRADAGARCVLTIQVDDVDLTVERLGHHDVTLLTGPMTRPWGPRTASVRDPSGHIWELAT